MKKILRVIIFLVLILTPLTLSSMVASDYQVTVGQTFTYDIVNAKIEMDYEGTTSNGNGYIIGGQPQTHGTQCVVEVTGVIPHLFVNWTVTSDVGSEYDLSSVFDLELLGFLFVYCLPLYELLGEMSFDDAEVFISYGTGLILIPFWDTYYWSDFVTMASDSFVSSFRGLGPYDELTMLADFKQISGNAIFEWFMGGPIAVEESGLILDMQFNHQLRMVFDSSSGVLQGIKMTSHVLGTSNNKEIELWIDYLAEIVGYDIDSYTFAPIEFASGFEWFIAISALSLITIPIIIYRRRKK